MNKLRKRRVAKAYGYIYKLDFKLHGQKVYSLENKKSQYDGQVNYSYNTFEGELKRLLEINS